MECDDVGALSVVDVLLCPCVLGAGPSCDYCPGFCLFRQFYIDAEERIAYCSILTIFIIVVALTIFCSKYIKTED
jgi:hypothetical protein